MVTRVNAPPLFRHTSEILKNSPYRCWVRSRDLRVGDYYHGCGIVVRHFTGAVAEGKTVYVHVKFNHTGKEGNSASFHPDALLEVWR